MKDLINAFPTSKKHLIGFLIAFIVSCFFGFFNLFGWNDLWFYDEVFGFEIKVNPFFAKSVIVLFMGFFTNWTFEYFQQRNLEEKPSQKDTIFDTIYFMISGYLGLLAVEVVLLILK